MPDDLEGYLQKDYPAEKAEIERLRGLVREILAVFDATKLENEGTWPYYVKVGDDPHGSRDFSFSTTAMILFALGLVTGRISGSVLAPAVGDVRRPITDGGGAETQAVITRTTSFIDDALTKLVAEAEAKQAEPGMQGEAADAKAPRASEPGPEGATDAQERTGVKDTAAAGDQEDAEEGPPAALTRSTTFGDDDPFTLTWLLELFAGAEGELASFRETLCDHARRVVENGLQCPPYDRVLRLRQDEEVPHSFTLLRVLQLREILVRLKGDDYVGADTVSDVRDHLFKRIHVHLSESQVPDSSFDAADLVFALEGWVLTAPTDPGVALIDRVLEVLAERQARTPYWRPLRPFKATAQGLVLLPQSVEIANSLLRICSRRQLDVRDYFSAHVDLLRTYTEWLVGRIFRGKTLSGPEFVGWESEHTYTLNRIHLWQTSQALIYLQHYLAMLQQHIARKLMKLASFVPTPPDPERLLTSTLDGDLEATAKKWRADDPFTGGSEHSRYNVYDQIWADFIRPRIARASGAKAAFSMLLYGPPGTGKSTIAESLRDALGYPMLTVTPSDFITSGSEGVEARAKAIFQVLEEQSDLIVLFDEIDQLLLDRDSKLYAAQGDVFKLLTPGMLTKINRLAKRRSVIFVIATNYYERIDRAIKRAGRIDARYLVLPPDLQRREAKLSEVLTGWNTLGERARDVAKATVRATYRELEDLALYVGNREPKATGDALAEAVIRALRETPPTIRLDGYFQRLGAQRPPAEWETTEVPLEEVALLAHLEVEALGDFPSEPQWLAVAVRDAIHGEVIRDDVVERSLRVELEKAHGENFFNQP